MAKIMIQNYIWRMA